MDPQAHGAESILTSGASHDLRIMQDDQEAGMRTMHVLDSSLESSRCGPTINIEIESVAGADPMMSPSRKDAVTLEVSFLCRDNIHKTVNHM
jgi:hypothetical protein